MLIFLLDFSFKRAKTSIAAQSSNCWNNPLRYTDENGEWAWVPFVIAAAVGGGFNWWAHGAEFSMAGLTTFGVGALAGVTGYVTGGAAYAAAGGTAALGGGGALLGMGSGAMRFIGTSSVSTVGNGLLLGDPVPSIGDQIKGLGVSVATAGIVNGTSAAIAGRNFWTGAEKAFGRGTFSFNNTPKIQAPAKVEPLGQQLLDATKPKTVNHLIIEGAGGFSESEINAVVYSIDKGMMFFLGDL